MDFEEWLRSQIKYYRSFNQERLAGEYEYILFIYQEFKKRIRMTKNQAESFLTK